MKRILILAIVALTAACASVGVRTVGRQPVTVIVGYVPGAACPSPSPGGVK